MTAFVIAAIHVCKERFLFSPPYVLVIFFFSLYILLIAILPLNFWAVKNFIRVDNCRLAHNNLIRPPNVIHFNIYTFAPLSRYRVAHEFQTLVFFFSCIIPMVTDDKQRTGMKHFNNFVMERLSVAVGRCCCRRLILFFF